MSKLCQEMFPLHCTKEGNKSIIGHVKDQC